MDNKNAAPERIDFLNGTIWEPEGFKEGQWWGHIINVSSGYAITRDITLDKAKAMAMFAVPQQTTPAPPEEIDALVAMMQISGPCWPDGELDTREEYAQSERNVAEYIIDLINVRRQPAAQPVPHVEVSKTAEELADDIVNKYVSAGFVASKAIRFEISQNIQDALDAHAIRVGELVRDASAKTAGKSPGNNSAAANIRALDIATILKGDK